MSMILIWLLITVACYGAVIGTAALMTFAERKVSAAMQYRYGPNRVGPFGLLQPLADGVKFIFKEEVIPAGANPWIFKLAPILTALPAMLAIAVIPFTGVIGTFEGTEVLGSIANPEIGILYVLAVTGVGVYGAILGGWASNSKYSLLGGLRASAQMVSYELSLILAVLAVVATTGSLNLHEIVAGQSGWFGWNVFSQPLAFVLFLVCSYAETNRHPFDFAECEPELVGGFHTEYSSMKFAMFFIGEYTAMVVMACLTTTLFFGGYLVPFWADAPWWMGLIAFGAKTSFFLLLFIWVRWTLPRFRYDQLMHLGWKVLFPLALINIFVTGLVISFGPGAN
ncbi:MAG: NADH-quinone oxidoreductase subunit NuoH [Planctomycetes bacterium]|nr:NADH-quinone oxidoreductase subunit NuoH [Planctomycetota bacterium]MCB9903492.1 NADH-quinone oxidoreductase subunit NuoH [Planctomycetota bacterium]